MQVIATEPPVVSAICDEPEGSVERHVYPMRLTPENLRTFYEKASEFRTLFIDEVNGDFHKFAEMFIGNEGDRVWATGLFWIVDDFVGIYYMTNIRQHDAEVHYTFFDRRHLGREELTKQMLKFVFKKFGFWRLTTEIPYYASKHTFNFVFRLGFKREGRRRKAVMYKDELFDTMLLGILREEAEAL
jgi:RimJ/RimL family protein N-acetyltransferase